MPARNYEGKTKLRIFHSFLSVQCRQGNSREILAIRGVNVSLFLQKYSDRKSCYCRYYLLWCSIIEADVGLLMKNIKIEALKSLSTKKLFNAHREILFNKNKVPKTLFSKNPKITMHYYYYNDNYCYISLSLLYLLYFFRIIRVKGKGTAVECTN